MKLKVSVDNRSGSVTARAGKADARDDNYNVDPGSGRYKKITRTLSVSDGAGAGQIAVTLETSSDFVGFVKDSYECDSLAFKSVGTIKLPSDSASQGVGVIHDSIAMGFRVERACRVHLTASVISDMDVAEVKLMGPAFADKPVRVFDDFDDTVEISKPGDYELRGAYQLSVRLPNPGLGGRPISVEMHATLKPVD
jgi:hypothetical protein